MKVKSSEEIRQLKKVMKQDMEDKPRVSKKKIKKIMQDYVNS